MVAKVMSWGVQEQGWRKGPWTPEEDKLLTEYVNLHGEGRWSSVARSSGLNRSGKSCRLRWVNYLRPGLKKGYLSPQEEGIIIELHAIWGNKWSTIASYLPGRTDNEIKNYWRTHFKKKEKSSQKQEKRKAQMLKQRQLQQQQQQEEENMNNVLSHADTSKENLNEGQERQEMVSMYPTLKDQCIHVMSQDVASWSDSMIEEGLWGGLWNLDDPHAHVDHTSDCNKIAMHNQTTAYSFGGDSNNFYNGGYNF